MILPKLLKTIIVAVLVSSPLSSSEINVRPEFKRIIKDRLVSLYKGNPMPPGAYSYNPPINNLRMADQQFNRAIDGFNYTASMVKVLLDNRHNRQYSRGSLLGALLQAMIGSKKRIIVCWELQQCLDAIRIVLNANPDLVPIFESHKKAFVSACAKITPLLSKFLAPLNNQINPMFLQILSIRDAEARTCPEGLTHFNCLLGKTLTAVRSLLFSEFYVDFFLCRPSLIVKFFGQNHKKITEEEIDWARHHISLLFDLEDPTVNFMEDLAIEDMHSEEDIANAKLTIALTIYDKISLIRLVHFIDEKGYKLVDKICVGLQKLGNTTISFTNITLLALFPQLLKYIPGIREMAYSAETVPDNEKLNMLVNFLHNHSEDVTKQFAWPFSNPAAQ